MGPWLPHGTNALRRLFVVQSWCAFTRRPPGASRCADGVSPSGGRTRDMVRRRVRAGTPSGAGPASMGRSLFAGACEGGGFLETSWQGCPGVSRSDVGGVILSRRVAGWSFTPRHLFE
jgi:hypothetical protein